MSKKKKIFFFITLVAANLFVYYPSFSFSAKADHLFYLIETAGTESLTDLIIQTYSYCRTRLLIGGDYILFRPLLYSLLSLERWLWGYNFVYWQVAGFALHLVIVGLLLRLLNAIRPHSISFAFTFFFSVLYIGVDLVTWHHIHGYLLFLILLLLMLTNFVFYIKGGQKESKRLLTMSLYLLGACFVNEFGVIVSLVMMLVLFGHRKFILKHSASSSSMEGGGLWRNNPLALMIPSLTYLYVSFLDYMLRFSGNDLSGKLSGFTSTFHIGKMVVPFASLFSSSFVLPFSPGLFKIFTETKNYISFIYVPKIMHYGVYERIMFALNVILQMMIFGVISFMAFNLIKFGRAAWQKFSADKKKQTQDSGTVIALGAMVLAGYVCVLIVYRVSYRTLVYMENHLYHYYVLTLLAIVILYTLFLLVDSLLEGQQKRLRQLVLVVLVFGSLLNGLQVYRLNQSGRVIFSPWSRRIRSIERFVNEHKQDSDFSFYLLNHDPANMIDVTASYGSEENRIRGYTSDYLFRKYNSKVPPKYYLVYEPKNGIIAFQNKGRAGAHLRALTD